MPNDSNQTTEHADDCTCASCDCERGGLKPSRPGSTASHPWYGPCDGLADEGACAECKKLGDALEAVHQIARMKLFPDDKTNRITLFTAIRLAKDALNDRSAV